jgi:hypothetical protein
MSQEGVAKAPMTTNTALPSEASVLERIRARAPTYWRYLREQPSWIAMFLFARTLTGRRLERWLSRAPFRSPAPVPDSAVETPDLNEVATGLIKNGVYVGLKLRPDTVRQILAFAEATPCFARDRQQAGFLPRDVARANLERERDVVAAHYFEAVERSPAITQLAKDPALLSIATSYIGHQPVHIRTRMWWSFPAARVSDADLHAAAQDKFHFDMNGWRTLKFFFYMTDTDHRGGAHKCIPGSHRRRALKHQITLTLGRPVEELEAYYGKDGFLTITGEAGTGFAEDPFIFHTGSLCQDQPRLVLELEYGPSAVSPSYRYGRLG